MGKQGKGRKQHSSGIFLVWRGRRLVTLDQAASAIGISAKTFAKYIQRPPKNAEPIPVFRVGGRGRLWLFDLDAVLNWLENWRAADQQAREDRRKRIKAIMKCEAPPERGAK